MSLSQVEFQKNATFVLNVTIFVPESKVIQNIQALDTPYTGDPKDRDAYIAHRAPFKAAVEAAADYFRFTRSGGKKNGWDALWGPDAVMRCLHLAGPYIQEHFPVQSVEEKLRDDRIVHRRLIIRPAHPNSQVDPGNDSLDGPGEMYNLYTDLKEPILMQVNREAVFKAKSY